MRNITPLHMCKYLASIKRATVYILSMYHIDFLWSPCSTFTRVPHSICSWLPVYWYNDYQLTDFSSTLGKLSCLLIYSYPTQSYSPSKTMFDALFWAFMQQKRTAWHSYQTKTMVGTHSIEDSISSFCICYKHGITYGSVATRLVWHIYLQTNASSQAGHLRQVH